MKRGNNVWKAIAGLVAAAGTILAIQIVGIAGYIGEAITDPANRTIWLTIAAIVFILTGAIEYTRMKS